jgi:hypothetical protein
MKPPIEKDNKQKRLQDIANAFLLKKDGEGLDFQTKNIKAWKTKFYEMRKEIGGDFTFRKTGENTYTVWKI